MKSKILTAIALSIAATNFACAPPALAPPKTLDDLSALEDLNGNNIPDLPVPEGVNVSETVIVVIENQIERDEALALVDSPIGIPDFVGVTVDFALTMVYEGGRDITHEGSRNLEPFTIEVEAACPESVLVTVTVSVTGIPFVGSFQVLEEQLTASRDPGAANIAYDCGTILTVLSSIDRDTGAPSVTFTKEDQ